VIGAAVALGGGAIWSMHFIAMNAADMGVPVAYDATLTFASLLLAIAAPALGLYVVGRGQGGALRLIVAGILTGLGVALMHYTGMAAMIMPATISYDPTLFYASIVIAVVAATVALWLAFNLRGNLQRFGSALIMGIAVFLPPSTLAYLVFIIATALLLSLLIFNAWKSQRTLADEF